MKTPVPSVVGMRQNQDVFWLGGFCGDGVWLWLWLLLLAGRGLETSPVFSPLLFQFAWHVFAAAEGGGVWESVAEASGLGRGLFSGRMLIALNSFPLFFVVPQPETPHRDRASNSSKPSCNLKFADGANKPMARAAISQPVSMMVVVWILADFCAKIVLIHC